MFLAVIGILLVAVFFAGDQWTSSKHIDGSDSLSAGNDVHSEIGSFYNVDRQKWEQRIDSGEAERSANEQDLLADTVKSQLNPITSRATNAKPASQRGKYRIEVSIGDQKVHVYSGEALIKEWTVSTGVNNCTPLGNFTTKQKGDWFFSEKYQQGGKWWVAFQGNYLFHSVPMDLQQNVIPEEAEKLGIPVSHGCVRLEVDHAKWLYDNIPRGTTVVIHE